MKRALIMGVLAGALMGATATVRAEMVTWNTTGAIDPGNGSMCLSTQCKTTFSSSGNTLTVKAYSTNLNGATNPYDDAWIEGRIALYGGGIGVANLVGADTGEGGTPEHAVDNQGAKDVVVFELPAGIWDPESFKLGWKSGDADVQAWIGGASLGASYDFRDVCFSGCSGVGGTVKPTLKTLAELGFTEITSGIPQAPGGENIPTGTSVPFNTTATGRYLVMSGKIGDPDDFFKISQLVAKVPVPGSALLLGLGLLMLFGRPRSRLKSLSF